MTRKELLAQLPFMDYSEFSLSPESPILSQSGVSSESSLASGGQEITPEDAITKLQAYANFKTDQGLEPQPNSVGFDFQKIADWIGKLDGKVDEIQVCFAFDNDDGRLAVVLWPYKNGLPASVDVTKEESPIFAPFNVGVRRPSPLTPQ